MTFCIFCGIDPVDPDDGVLCNHCLFVGLKDRDIQDILNCNDYTQLTQLARHRIEVSVLGLATSEAWLKNHRKAWGIHEIQASKKAAGQTQGVTPIRGSRQERQEYNSTTRPA